MEIDYDILFQVLMGLGWLSIILFAIWTSYKYVMSPAKYNADELLVEDTGDIFQQGKYVYYSKNSDILFISPTKPTSFGVHPLAQNSTYYVGEL